MVGPIPRPDYHCHGSVCQGSLASNCLTAGISDVQVALWEHVEVDVDFLNPLHGLVSSSWGSSMFGLACTRRSFARGLCGAAAVAFVSHRLLGHDLPSSYDALLLLHQDLKASFAATCNTATVLPKPWCWGLGTADVFGLASELLQAHGCRPPKLLCVPNWLSSPLEKLRFRKHCMVFPLGNPLKPLPICSRRLCRWFCLMKQPQEQAR